MSSTGIQQQQLDTAEAPQIDKTKSIQDSVFSIGSIPMSIPASNYWNPFGATTLPGGAANPNRVAGINAPAAGVPLTISNYLFSDFGPMRVTVRLSMYCTLVSWKIAVRRTVSASPSPSAMIWS